MLPPLLEFGQLAAALAVGKHQRINLIAVNHCSEVLVFIGELVYIQITRFLVAISVNQNIHSVLLTFFVISYF